jgi:signal transduction histidine kinase/CheY-like chemotaxis protein
LDRILYCIAFQHDWRWTLAAGLVCVLGVGTAYRLLGRAREMVGARQRNLAVLAAFVGGLAVFSTHFMAMQGFDAGAPAHYGVWLTVSSFFMAFGSIALASLVALARRGPFTRGLAAALAMAGVSAMHFLGVSALAIPGVIAWDPVMVAAAVAAGMILAALSAAVVHGPAPWRITAAGVGAALAVIVLHFTAMSAMTIVPQAVAPMTWTVSPGAMTLVIGAMIIGMAGVAATLVGMAWASRSSAVSQIRDAIEAMPDGLAFYDADDRLVLWNDRYARVNPELASHLQPGMTFREIIEIGLAGGLYADAVGREETWIKERMATRKASSTTLEQHIAGDRWLRVSDRRTRAGGIVTVCTDITDLKRDAHALGEARDAAQAANSAKSQFLANMSHEIRTPLNGVIGVAQALANTELSARQQEMLDLIRSSGQTLQVLLSDILDLARVESGRLELSDEAFDLGRAVRDAAQLYEAQAREKGLQFFVEIDEAVDGWIKGDVVRLKQILTNLVSNAVKFTSTGFVCLTAAPGPVLNGEPTLRFSIEDTGIGFDSDTRARLFGRFEQADGGITRKFGGSGLGLSISRQLAEMMGGNLDCESEPDGGSAFILTVPLHLAEAPAMKGAGETPAPADETRRLRVLLADDHPVNRKVVEMILTQADVELTEVEDGAQALQAVRDADFDVILMDMQMPVMDGLTATREIRLHEAAMGLPRTPVVMLTANALAEHIAAAEAAGADRHLAKPFDAAELLDLVATLPGAVAASMAA